MLNVIEFRNRALRMRRSGLQRRTANVDTDNSGLTSRITSLQSKARGEIHDAILMLDLAAQHARQFVKRVHDPKVKKDFDENIAIIERLLQIARDMALRL